MSIRDKKRAEIKSFEGYANLINGAPHSIVAVDLKGNITYCNKAAEILTGYVKRELVGKHFSRVSRIKNNDISHYLKLFKELLKGKKVAPFEMEARRKDGKSYWIEVHLSRIKAKGKVTGFQINTRDITERKKIEKAESQREKTASERVRLLNDLQSLDGIDDILTRVCEAVRNSGLFERAVITLHKPGGRIVHLGQVGLSPNIVKRARQAPPIDDRLRSRITSKKFHISDSFFIPAEAGLDLTKSGRYIPQKRRNSVGGDWQPGDELFVPLRDFSGETMGYLSVDTPTDSSRPDIDTIQTLEMLVEAAAARVREVEARMALKRERDFSQSILETANSLIVCLDADAKIRVFNQECERVTDYRREEVLGKRWPELFLPPGERHAKLKSFTDWVRAHPHDQYEGPIVTKSGKIRTILWSNTAILGSGKKDVMAIAVGQDITERKRAEVALRESEEKYRTLFESAPEAIMIIDPDGIILDCDEEAAKVSQLSRQQLIGKHFTKLDIFKEKEVAKAIEFFSPLVSERSVEFFEIQVVGAGDETRWVEVFPALLKRDDEVYAIQLIFRDITERKRVEEALRESEEKYRQLVSTTTEAIMVFDADTRQFIEVNKACEDLYGYTREEFLNLRHTDITAEPEKSEDSINKARKGKLKKIPLRYHKKKDGTVFPVEISASNFELGGRRVLCGVIRDITDRNRAEEALRESEEKFRTLAEQSPNMIFIYKKGRVIYANEKCEEIMGYKKDEFYSPNFDFLALITPEHRKLVKASLARHIMGKEVDPYEYALITKEGKRIEAILSTKLISYRGEDAVLGMITDITERKRAEEALQASENKYRTLLENLPQKIFLKDRNSVYLSCNENYARDLKIKAEEIAGKTDYDFFPKELAKKYRADDKRIMVLGKTEDIEERYIQEGQEVFVHTVKMSVKDEQGNLIGLLGIFWDITERKQAEDALKQSEKKYRTLVETAQEGIGISDQEENLTFVNQAFADMLGYKKQELLGKNLSQISEEEEFTKFKKETQKRKQGKLSKYEAKLFTKKGKPKYFYVSAAPIRTKNAGFKGTLAVLTDITELKRAREQNLLLEASKALSRTLKLDQVLKIATEKIAKALKADRCSVSLFDKSADSAAIRHVFIKKGSPSSIPTDKHTPLDEHFPQVKEELTAKGHLQIKNAETDPLPASVRSYFRKTGIKSSLTIPLFVDKKLFGVFHIGSTKKLRSFTSEEISLTQTIANQVAVAVENARLLELVRKSSEDLKTLSTQLINVQEDEQKKIAQELHDEIGQTLFAMKMNLDVTMKNLPPDIEKLEDIKSRLSDTEDLLSQTIDQIRNLTTDLRPSMLDDFGLTPALRWYMDNFSKRTNIKVYLTTKNFKGRLSSEIETTLYRIIQEALTNVAKHAQATEVSILLSRKNSTVSLSLQDNGIGFDTKKITFPKDRFGLFSIKERIKLLNGEFKIGSKPNRGTKLSVKISLAERLTRRSV